MYNRLKVPFVTSLRRVDELVSLELMLETDSGLVGIGGAAPTKAITGETLDTLEAAFTGFRQELIGADPECYSELLSGLAKALPGQTSARAAVSIAFFDLLAKKQDIPLYKLFGRDRDCPPTSYTISLDSPEEMARQSVVAVQDGYSILKIKLGGRDGLDSRRMAAIHDAVGPNVRYRLDPNQGWTLSESLQYLDDFKTEEYPVDFLEQPLPAADIKGMAELRHSGFCPVVADEAVFSAEDAKKIIDAKAADIINIKLMKCGGLSEALEICRLSEAAGLGIMIGCMLEGAASIIAAIHLAFARKVVRYADLDAPLLFSRIPDELTGLYHGNEISLIRE